MSYWNIQRPFVQDKAVVGSIYFNAEASVTIDSDNVSLNEYGSKSVTAGLFLAKVNGVNRFLPADYVRGAAVATGSPSVQVNMPEVFKTGDVLYATEPEGLLTLAATWAAADTATIRFSEPSLGIDVQYTHTQVGANLTALTPEIIAALNLSTNPLSKYARFEIGTAGQIKVFSKGLVFTITVDSLTNGDGTFVATTQLASVPRLVGTIASINNVTRTLTLGADAAVGVGVGGHVGTLAEEIYGLYNHSVDFTDRPVQVLKAIDRADRVYLAAVPYINGRLIAKFDRIKFV